MIGELIGEISLVSGRYRAEGVVLGIFNVSRPDPHAGGTVTHNSLTLFVEVLDSDDEVVESKLFAVRSVGEWDGELHVIIDDFTNNFFSGSTSIFNFVVESLQVNAGNVRTTGAFLADDYPVDTGSATVFYQLRGLKAQCRRISSVAPMSAEGVPTIRSPKLAIFRNPTTHTKRWFVRSRSFYQENWVVPLEEMQLAPTGDNSVSSANAIGSFTEGRIYTGDQHPEIDLNGTRRARFAHHSERGTIEPFYFLADLRGGKSIRVTRRELYDNMTADPVLTNEYPADGSPRSDESIAGSNQFTVETRFYRIG